MLIRKIRLYLQNNKKKVITIVAIAFFLSLYLGGIFAQVTTPQFFSSGMRFTLNPFKCVLYNFTIGKRGLIFVLIVYMCIGMYAIIKYKDKHELDTVLDERGFKTENSGVYGTSTLLKPEQVRDYCEVEKLDRTTGIIIGKFAPENDPRSVKQVVSIPPDGKRYKYNSFGKLAVEEYTKKDGTTGIRPVREKLPGIDGNRHMIVTGGPGSGKSFCFARPAIFQSIINGESCIVTDPKGELFCDTAEYARQHGYTVKIFNLDYLPGSDAWDALSEVTNGEDVSLSAQEFCNIIVSNFSDGKSNGDAYQVAEKNLLTALVLYAATSPNFTYPRTLGGMYDFFTNTSDDDIDTAINLSDNTACKMAWGLYNKASQNFKGNIRSGLGASLQVLQTDIVRNITGNKDIDLVLPGKQKCIYYVVISDMNTTFKFLSSLFFSCLFNRLVQYSRKQPDLCLPVPVNVIMDEFIAIGKIPDFSVKLATVRSAHINISIIFQTLAQLQAEYPEWETIVACCSTFVCLSCNDLTTAEYISKRSGTETVALESTRVDRPLLSAIYVPDKISHTNSVGQRAVLQPAEVINLASKRKAIAAVGGANVFIMEKFPYTDMIDPNSLKRQNMYEYIPNWVNSQNSARFSGKKQEDNAQRFEPYQSKSAGTYNNNNADNQNNHENNSQEVEECVQDIPAVGIDEETKNVIKEVEKLMMPDDGLEERPKKTNQQAQFNRPERLSEAGSVDVEMF